MKHSIIYQLSLCISFACSVFTSCVNEEAQETVLPKELAIQVSIETKDTQTRASDALDVEKIMRYDIFIFDHDTKVLDRYLSESYTIGVEQFSRVFSSDVNLYNGTKDVFVIANDTLWKNKSQEQISALTRDDVQNLVLTYNQNVIEKDGKLTEFTGYKKTDGDYEPFVMTVKKENVDFRDTPILKVDLKRAYAKVILQFATELTDTSTDTEWHGLKSIKIEAIQNIPNSAAVVAGGVASTPSAISSYIIDPSSPIDLNNVSLIEGYSYDTFEEDALGLRIPPYTPALVDGKLQVAAIKLTFSVGPISGTAVTKEFTRTISIGDSSNGYRIEANYAYVIKISSSKTNSGISVDTTVLPWNSESLENEVLPEY